MKIDLFAHYPALAPAADALERAKDLLIETYESGGKLLLCGNGGSAADCDHIAGELLKGFASERKLTPELRCALGEDLASRLQMGLPAISLPSQGAVISAFCNDVDAKTVYAQLTLALAKPGDVLICISTSGNSANVVAAAQTAKALGVRVIALVGEKECALDAYASVALHAPACETYRVQEYHLPMYHWLCAEVEDYFFD
ncbi:MAG: SIS domain-containing protein [Ruminococcaceae bacterium]|nr:SIS domain-containing protein [Oscillospiraceae bacterium]